MQFFGADDILKMIPILHGSLSSYDSQSTTILEAMRTVGNIKL
jgi:hypothetical protein